MTRSVHPPGPQVMEPATKLMSLPPTGLPTTRTTTQISRAQQPVLPGTHARPDEPLEATGRLRSARSPSLAWLDKVARMSSTPEHLKQDQGVLENPVRELEEEDEDEALDELAAAALALGVAPDHVNEPDGGITEVG